MKLSKVDDLILPQHFWLGPDDHCYYLREYTAGKGYTYGETNNLISNLKKSMDRRGRPEWQYKERAIETAGIELRLAVGDKTLQDATIVPMPPSKAKDDPLYDDRMSRIVGIMTNGLMCDIRELVVQRQSTEAAHTTIMRLQPDALYANFAVDEALANPAPARILVVDDVLTAGAHFVAIKRRLRERFPGVQIAGCFYARRAVPDLADET